MKKNKDIFCVIPARGGSKGIPKKNLVTFKGEPLISWTIKAALASGKLTRIFVSTDCTDIAGISSKYGAEVPFMRPSHLAEDRVHSIHVVQHVLKFLETREGMLPYGIMMLLPTSPLRTAQDVVSAIDIFMQERANAVISVVDLGKYMTNLRYIQDGKLVRVAQQENPNAQRQGLETLYSVNGSIFLAQTDMLLEAGTFHIEGALPYIMPVDRSVDINSLEDLEFARQIACSLDT